MLWRQASTETDKEVTKWAIVLAVENASIVVVMLIVVLTGVKRLVLIIVVEIV